VVAIIIRVGDEEFEAELTEDSAPETVREIMDALPITATSQTWGDEIYFAIAVHIEEENARAAVSKGDLGYWPAGSCFCIFYGRTPMSPSEDEIVPASPVNVVGRVRNPDGFKRHGAGEQVHIRLAE